MKIWKELWHYSDRSICKTQYNSVQTTQYWIRLVDCPSLHTQFKNDPSSRWSVTNFDPHLTVWPCQFLFSSEKSRDSRKSSPCTIQHQYVYSCLSIQSETELGGVSGYIGGLWRGGGGTKENIFILFYDKEGTISNSLNFFIFIEVFTRVITWSVQLAVWRVSANFEIYPKPWDLTGGQYCVFFSA